MAKVSFGIGSLIKTHVYIFKLKIFIDIYFIGFKIKQKDSSRKSRIPTEKSKRSKITISKS